MLSWEGLLSTLPWAGFNRADQRKATSSVPHPAGGGRKAWDVFQEEPSETRDPPASTEKNLVRICAGYPHVWGMLKLFSGNLLIGGSQTLPIDFGPSNMF